MIMNTRAGRRAPMAQVAPSLYGLALVIFAYCSASSAQETPSKEPSSAPTTAKTTEKKAEEPASPEKTEPSRVSIFVQDLESDANIEIDHLRTLNGFVVHAVSKFEQLNVVTKDQIRRAGDLFAERQSTGCGLTEECLAELADAMGARYVIFGRVSYVEENYILAMSLMDSQSVDVIQRVHLQEKKLLALGHTIDEQMIYLLKPLLRQMEKARAKREAEKQETNMGVGTPAQGADGPSPDAKQSADASHAATAEETDASAVDPSVSPQVSSPADPSSNEADVQTGVSWLAVSGGLIAVSGAAITVTGCAGAIYSYSLFQEAMNEPNESDSRRTLLARTTAVPAIAGGIGVIMLLAGAGVTTAGLVSE